MEGPVFSFLGLGRGCLRDLLNHLARGDHMLAESELLGLQPKGQPNHLGKVQHGEAEVALDVLGGGGLLQVEVEVAERAGRDQAIRARVEGVGHMATRLAQ